MLCYARLEIVSLLDTFTILNEKRIGTEIPVLRPEPQNRSGISILASRSA